VKPFTSLALAATVAVIRRSDQRGAARAFATYEHCRQSVDRFTVWGSTGDACCKAAAMTW